MRAKWESWHVCKICVISTIHLITLTYPWLTLLIILDVIILLIILRKKHICTFFAVWITLTNGIWSSFSSLKIRIRKYAYLQWENDISCKKWENSINNGNDAKSYEVIWPYVFPLIRHFFEYCYLVSRTRKLFSYFW